jgi:hypothetical protein
VRREYDRTEQGCPFCSISSGDVQLENRLSVEQISSNPSSTLAGFLNGRNSPE